MTPGVIVIEGPDGAGKSTLAEHLSYGRKVKKIHMTYRQKNNMFNYQLAALSLAERWVGQGYTVVIDRHWPSELVYGKVCRGGSRWPHMSRMMDRVLRKIGVCYVMCLPGTVDELVENHKKLIDDDHPYDDQQYKLIAASYKKLWAGRCPGVILPFLDDVAVGPFMEDPHWLLYDWRKESFKSIVDRIEDVLSLADYYKPTWLKQHPRCRNFGGSSLSGLQLVVGEQSNPKSNQKAWPFVEYANSSLFLAQLLDLLHVPEKNLMWVNAKDCGFAEILVELTNERQGYLPIICLGKTAQELTYKHVKQVKNLISLPHPSYAKRFNVPDYVRQVREAFTLRGLVTITHKNTEE